ncbi:hypothetical protein NDU88_000694 [Pleurodeles waltl]|uniref:Uncharacterized protein n=1 Tax=Pleurodeles waltl TaxID=8319 RepID=A0AAV7UU40_PLEWA|nr:hypothetical protein NDU88_000694 [Pleurodeles waltl]
MGLFVGGSCSLQFGPPPQVPQERKEAPQWGPSQLPRGSAGGDTSLPCSSGPQLSPPCQCTSLPLSPLGSVSAGTKPQGRALTRAAHSVDGLRLERRTSLGRQSQRVLPLWGPRGKSPASMASGWEARRKEKSDKLFFAQMDEGLGAQPSRGVTKEVTRDGFGSEITGELYRFGGRPRKSPIDNDQRIPAASIETHYYMWRTGNNAPIDAYDLDK